MPCDPDLAGKAAEIASRMTLRDKACLVVGARSAMAGEIVGSQARSVPGAAGETVAFEKYGIGRAAWSYRQMDFGLSDARMDGVRAELVKVL